MIQGLSGSVTKSVHSSVPSNTVTHLDTSLKFEILIIPSGHTLIACAMLFVTWLDYYSNYRKVDKCLGKMLTKICLLVLAVMTGCLVAYSRLYLGVHSLDQVLYGATMALWLALFSHTTIRKPLMQHL